MSERVEYDEFSMFRENAEEFGIAWEGPPTVRREVVGLGDGRTLSALVWGDGPPEMVLIHGGAQNAHTWDTVALALARPLVAIDLPGHGHSGPPAEGPTDLDTNAADIAVTIEALAPEAGMVVGMSLGGLTSIALATARPDLVSRLALVDITPGVNHDKAKAIAAFVNGPASFDSFDDLLARTIEHNPTRTETSLRRGILHNAEQLDDGSWVWRHARHRVFADRNVRRDYGVLWDSIEESSAPLMLVRGTRAQSVIDDADEAELRQRRPDARVEHVDAGHSVQGDAPIELARLIEDFAAHD
ncbi:MAG: alpha/beta fold hydrolase [Acidimicrobiales bacterium]